MSADGHVDRAEAAIRRLIEAGCENDKLPPEGDIAVICNVGVKAVRKAMTRLRKEGSIVTIAGSGTFISHPGGAGG